MQDNAMPSATAPSSSNLSAAANQVSSALDALLQSAQLEVPMLPEIASKVVTLTNDPESDAAKLAKLIQSDQSLAGHVMRIANSSAYSPNSTLVSLQQAITRLGMGLIGEIALAASINTKMFKTPGYEQLTNQIWNHALATALWSKEVARACRRNVETSFLCGLLHSIGRPVTIQSILENASKLSIALEENEVLELEDTYSATVGLGVAKQWKMPQVVCEVIAFFKDNPQANDQVAIVSGAAQIAKHILEPEALPREDLLTMESFASINLYQDEIEALLEKSEAISATMESMCQ